MLAIALVVAPFPLGAVLLEAGSARTLPPAVVSARSGDLYVGKERITATRAEDSQPDWSPDGRRIAFVRQEPGRRSASLFVVRRDGGGLERLTRGDQVVAMPAWSPDGGRIAYAASPLVGGSFDVWVVEPVSGRSTRVTRTPAEEAVPAWGRDGRLRFATLEPGDPWPHKASDAGTPRKGPRELLPDFDQRPPFRLTISGTTLGFASATDNVGEGPIWIRGARDSLAQTMRAQQLVRLSDGGVKTYDGAGRMRYTPESTHSHWHLLDFQRYELRDQTGKVLVRDRKSGFCLADHYGLARRRVASFSGPRFLANCAAWQPQALAVEQGTSSGYTDLYPPHFHGQNLQLRGIPDGVYVLVHRANADETLEELDYTNNAASLRIRLTWHGGAPRVETLRSCASSDSCDAK
ncbi:MAG: PD40 domain-containing protein [Actinobacteria bacterium]|nr:PD40 domain-containing protein [Actinomycetota bacterium]